MQPRLDQLEALVWIARLGSFRAAARRLGVSQPAVSGRIRELERRLRFRVVERSRARARIAPRGVEVVRFAEQMLGLAESFAARFAEREALAGTIRMGAADSFALTHLSPLLSRIAQRHPQAHVALDIGFSANLDAKLRAGELDIAFLTAPAPAPDVTIEPLEELELGWFASPRLAIPKRRLGPADLARHPIITNPRPSHLWATIMEWFAHGGAMPPRVNTCTSLTVMARLAADGFGISLLPVTLLEREIARGKLRRLSVAPPPAPHRLAVAWRAGPGRLALRPIVELAREVVGRS